MTLKSLIQVASSAQLGRGQAVAKFNLPDAQPARPRFAAAQTTERANRLLMS